MRYMQLCRQKEILFENNLHTKILTELEGDHIPPLPILTRSLAETSGWRDGGKKLLTSKPICSTTTFFLSLFYTHTILCPRGNYEAEDNKQEVASSS